MDDELLQIIPSIELWKARGRLGLLEYLAQSARASHKNPFFVYTDSIVKVQQHRQTQNLKFSSIMTVVSYVKQQKNLLATIQEGFSK